MYLYYYQCNIIIFGTEQILPQASYYSPSPDSSSSIYIFYIIIRTLDSLCFKEIPNQFYFGQIEALWMDHPSSNLKSSYHEYSCC